MKLTEIIDPRCIRNPLQASEKFAVITELVDLLADSGKLTDRDLVLRTVLARERIRSTGLGDGLAVPHGKSPACPFLSMCLGRPAHPVNFESIDGRPCEFVVLLVGPMDKTGPHIQALAGIARLWLDRTFRSAVLSVHTADELYAAIQQHEKLHAP